MYCPAWQMSGILSDHPLQHSVCSCNKDIIIIIIIYPEFIDLPSAAKLLSLTLTITILTRTSDVHIVSADWFVSETYHYPVICLL